MGRYRVTNADNWDRRAKVRDCELYRTSEWKNSTQDQRRVAGIVRGLEGFDRAAYLFLLAGAGEDGHVRLDLIRFYALLDLGTNMERFAQSISRLIGYGLLKQVEVIERPRPHKDYPLVEGLAPNQPQDLRDYGPDIHVYQVLT